MFVDEMTIYAKAGNGGDGVVRWLREHGRAWGGPAGGNGGRGGSVFVRAIRDNNILSKYTGDKNFIAERGEDGHSKSMYGKNGENLVIDLPRGSIVTNLVSGRKVELFTEGEEIEILKGGNGGLGNEHFKSAINRSPEEHTEGKKGEEAEFHIEVSLVVDVGLIGEPNAGKSTLLNALTHATSKIGDYPFTTLSPHLGDLYGFVIADIPGLIEGAADGKGLGHTFLRHVQRTAMLLHLVSLEEPEPLAVYARIRNELTKFDETLCQKPEWVVLTKTDMVSAQVIDAQRALFEKEGHSVFTISVLDDTSLKNLQDSLIKDMRSRVVVVPASA